MAPQQKRLFHERNDLDLKSRKEDETNRLVAKYNCYKRKQLFLSQTFHLISHYLKICKEALIKAEDKNHLKTD